MKNPRIRVIGGLRRGRMIRLTEPVTRVGRGPDADVILKDAGLGAVDFAFLKRDDGSIYVRRLQTNPVYVGRTEVVHFGELRLEAGQILSAGNSVRIEFQADPEGGGDVWRPGFEFGNVSPTLLAVVAAVWIGSMGAGLWLMLRTGTTDVDDAFLATPEALQRFVVAELGKGNCAFAQQGPRGTAQARQKSIVDSIALAINAEAREDLRAALRFYDSVLEENLDPHCISARFVHKRRADVRSSIVAGGGRL